MALEKRDPRGQGDQGELSAALWFASQGAAVFIPLFHSPRDFDLIADWHGAVRRVQVKTSTAFRKRRWDVAVCTRGGNRSWSGLVKHLDPAKYEMLFVVVGDGRRWMIPSDDVGGRYAIRLGGPRYADYEIDTGEPLVPAPATLDSAPFGRDSRAVKGDAL